jgi:hypothetical protein
MHKASDVMHEDPDAILSALSDLTANQMKELQKNFPEKYGVSLETFLKKELQGSRLNVALDIVRSGNTFGATDFHVYRYMKLQIRTHKRVPALWSDGATLTGSCATAIVQVNPNAKIESKNIEIMVLISVPP